MISNIQNNFTFQNTTAGAGQGDGTLGFILPESVLRQDLMSGTSEAMACFVGQEFSNKLQAYMINYVISISSYYPLYA